MNITRLSALLEKISKKLYVIHQSFYANHRSSP